MQRSQLGGEHSSERELVEDPEVAGGVVLVEQQRGQVAGEVKDEAREVTGRAWWGLRPSLRTTGLSSSEHRRDGI